MISKNNYIVNIKNIKNNVGIIRKVVGGKVRICAIVKANAYGMGMPAVVDAICHDVDYFGVANVWEAMELRKVNKCVPVLILGEVNLDQIEWCALNNVAVTISTLDELYYIESSLSGCLLKIHLAVNTGLNRLGFESVLKFKQAIKMIMKSDVMTLDGCFTHFATKSNDEDFIAKQYEIFTKYTKFLPNCVVHCANSYVTLNYGGLACDMVRPGFALYGEHICNYKLKRALSITSEVIHITNVRAGSSVGYDRTFVAPYNMRVAVIPIGYADGLDRRLSNQGYVLINGKKANIVGNICMDVALVDVTYIPYVFVGSKVTIVGKDGDEIITPLDIANILGTSAYEVLLKFNYRRMNYITVDE